MIAIISYWIKHYILLKIKRFCSKFEISKNMHALAFVYKHLDNLWQVIIEAMLPRAQCQDVTFSLFFAQIKAAIFRTYTYRKV
jgi:hypothetical protein